MKKERKLIVVFCLFILILALTIILVICIKRDKSKNNGKYPTNTNIEKTITPTPTGEAINNTITPSLFIPTISEVPSTIPPSSQYEGITVMPTSPLFQDIEEGSIKKSNISINSNSTNSNLTNNTTINDIINDDLTNNSTSTNSSTNNTNPNIQPTISVISTPSKNNIPDNVGNITPNFVSYITKTIHHDETYKTWTETKDIYTTTLCSQYDTISLYDFEISANGDRSYITRKTGLSTEEINTYINNSSIRDLFIYSCRRLGESYYVNSNYKIGEEEIEHREVDECAYDEEIIIGEQYSDGSIKYY